MSHKLLISAKSLKPVGFIGWPDLAVALLQKYSCKVLLSEESPTKESIQRCLQDQGISFAEEDFVTELDVTDAGISLVALEPTTREAIPSMEGKIFASICGPFSQDWKKQIEICQERNVSGIISEILPDELPSDIAHPDLEYFCKKALFLPPCAEQGKQNNVEKVNGTLILHEEEEDDFETNRLSNIKNLLPVLEQIKEFEIIQYTPHTDFALHKNICRESQAIYSLLHYPQLNLYYKLIRGNLTLHHHESSLDSPLRNFLSDYEPLEFDTPRDIQDISVRTQILRILGKKQFNMPPVSPGILNQFTVESLLPTLEKKLQISSFEATNGKLDQLQKAISWERLLHFKVQLKRFPYAPFPPNLGDHVDVNPLRHPVGSSAIEALLEKEPESSIEVYANPAFVNQVIELPNAAATSYLFNALLEASPQKCIDACEHAKTPEKALRVAELLYYSCLLAKDDSTQEGRIAIATNFYDKLIGSHPEVLLTAHSYKAKLGLLKSGGELSKESFPGLENHMQPLASAVYLASQQELFIPSFRDNAKRFLGQFDELFSDSPVECNGNNHSSLTIPCALGETEKVFERTRKLVADGKTSFKYVLHYLFLSYCYTNKPDQIISALDQLGEDFTDSRPFDLSSRMYKIVLGCLQGNADCVLETFKKMAEEKKHVSKLAPLFTTFPLCLIVMAKALQSDAIEETAKKMGNNLFFDYVDSEDFGEVAALPEGDQSELIKIVSAFISD